MSKRLMALPVIGIVVAMLGVSVFAAAAEQSPSMPGWHVWDYTAPEAEFPNHEVTPLFVMEDGFLNNEVPEPVLADIAGIQDKINTKDNTLKPEDFSVAKRFNIHLNSAPGVDEDYVPSVSKVAVDYKTSQNEVAILLHYNKQASAPAGGKWQFVGIAQDASSIEGAVNGCSPFAILKASAKSSAQTGEYAGTYIIMVSTALVACGAVFALRSQKTEN